MTRTRLVAGIVLIAGIALVVGTLQRDSPRNPASLMASAPDLSDHPIYAQYEFHRDESVINLGTQPLYASTGLISAAMARDAVLREALETLGLEVRFFPFLKGYDVNFFLANDQLDAGIGGDMPALTAAAHLDVVVTSLMQLGFTSVVAAQPMLLGELSGKAIAYAFGSNAHYTLLAALASEGLTEDDVRLVAMDADAMPVALDDGTVDAFAAWEPFVSLGLALDAEHSAIRRGMSSGYLYFSRSFFRAQPQAVREILAAQARAMNWIRTSVLNRLSASEWALADGRRITAVAGALSAVQLANMAANDLLGLDAAILMPADLLADGGRLQLQYEFLQRLGEISVAADWEQIRRNFDGAIATEVMEHAVAFRLQEFRYDAHPSDSP